MEGTQDPLYYGEIRYVPFHYDTCHSSPLCYLCFFHEYPLTLIQSTHNVWMLPQFESR